MQVTASNGNLGIPYKFVDKNWILAVITGRNFDNQRRPTSMDSDSFFLCQNCQGRPIISGFMLGGAYWCGLAHKEACYRLLLKIYGKDEAILILFESLFEQAGQVTINPSTARRDLYRWL